ncbi:MAG: DUF1566 domain-containing protein [Pseudomonadota bacterium]
MKLFVAWLLVLVVAPVWADHTATHLCSKNVPGRFTNRYTYNADYSVTDRVTGLVWQRCPLGAEFYPSTKQCGQLQNGKTQTWQEALQQAGAEALRTGKAWRVPNIKELISLIELNCTSPMLDIKAFPTGEYAYWSSTPNTAMVESIVTQDDMASQPTSDPTTPAGTLVMIRERIQRYYTAYTIEFSSGSPKLAHIDDLTKLPVLLVRDAQ